MKNFYSIIIAATLIFFIVLPLRAQDGCLDSPENPTAILGLVGVIGVGIANLYNCRKKPK